MISPITVARSTNLDSLHRAIPLQTMPFDGNAALACFLVSMTTLAQAFSLGIQGCGGPVDVATITADAGLRFV